MLLVPAARESSSIRSGRQDPSRRPIGFREHYPGPLHYAAVVPWGPDHGCWVPTSCRACPPGPFLLPHPGRALGILSRALEGSGHAVPSICPSCAPPPTGLQGPRRHLLHQPHSAWPAPPPSSPRDLQAQGHGRAVRALQAFQAHPHGPGAAPVHGWVLSSPSSPARQLRARSTTYGCGN